MQCDRLSLSSCVWQRMQDRSSRALKVVLMVVGLLFSTVLVGGSTAVAYPVVIPDEEVRVMLIMQAPDGEGVVTRTVLIRRNEDGVFTRVVPQSSKAWWESLSAEEAGIVTQYEQKIREQYQPSLDHQTDTFEDQEAQDPQDSEDESESQKESQDQSEGPRYPYLAAAINFVLLWMNMVSGDGGER